jgi:hypothetical protein
LETKQNKQSKTKQKQKEIWWWQTYTNLWFLETKMKSQKTHKHTKGNIVQCILVGLARLIM